MGDSPQDQTARVRAGYNLLSRAYRADTADDATQRQYAEWLGPVLDRAPAGGDVLDLGCGNGIPASKWLSDSGFRVTGVDLSDTMVARARELVPGATFLRGDATMVDEIDFDLACLDAVVSFYALIHMPITDQPGVISRASRWLRPGGLFVATVGHTAWSGTQRDWLGGGAPMSWSHPGASTYRAWFERAGLAIDDERFVVEGTGGHTLFIATRVHRGDGC
ncbi:MAG: class I SAM-dependent methyltransferase [Dermatophilaceae bacterium]